ncbi:MAG: hypothetical protein EP330_24605 [Deltaproteobacteria bacterium]|nr:MAG: hypothetical protein EP330_24605 [Deltaproteobacteria bacterium]
MRSDLAALDVEALALLTNRGLAKRAAKMLDKGEGPSIDEDGEGTVTATFPDGVVTTWPADVALADSACSCGAAKACRHRVATALAYQGEATPERGPWDPGAFTDEELEALVGANALRTARARLSKGVEAEVVRGEQPRVHLANGTVRFPVRDALAMAHCDALGAERNVMIVLAVWAFREAGEGPEPSVQLVLGESEGIALDAAEAVLHIVHTSLSHGIADLPRTAAADLSRAREAARSAGWTWVADGLEDLEELLECWRARSQRYAPERVAWVLGELIARVRAARANAPPSPGWFLGRGVAPETALDHLTLMGLGARLRPADEEVEVDVYLLDLNGGAVLVYRRRIPREAPEKLATRRVGDTRMRLADLASGVLTTQGAFRRANRLMRLASQRGGRKHDLKTGGGHGWKDLPLTIRSTAEVREVLTHRPPRTLRPRLLAEDLRVVAIDEVLGVSWQPGEQQLLAHLRLPDGSDAVLELEHDPLSPGGCAAVEAALRDGAHHVAGRVHLHGAQLVISPTAIASQGGLTLPAFAAGGTVEAAVHRTPLGDDPVHQALREARAALAEAAHRGLDQIRPSERAAKGLDAVGLTVAARRMLAATTPEAWADAWLTVVTALEIPDVLTP